MGDQGEQSSKTAAQVGGPCIYWCHVTYKENVSIELGIRERERGRARERGVERERRREVERERENEVEKEKEGER